MAHLAIKVFQALGSFCDMILYVFSIYRLFALILYQCFFFSFLFFFFFFFQYQFSVLGAAHILEYNTGPHDFILAHFCVFYDLI